MIGQVVGQYRITGVIGQGGMGVVYAAEHSLLHRPAAVKVLLPEYSQNQEIVTRFFNEARAATTIRHPGIVEIYDFGFHTDRSAFIVMEHLQGESLGARMMRGRMSPQSVLAILRQLAGALGAAHAKGIVHRDLKPDNVFLVPDPEVPGGERIKLLDFGIAKLAAEQGQGHTRTGSVMGTPTYMAPEQCRGVAIDHRADLYSAGCILFELCTGVPPFVGEGVGDVLAAHIHVPPPQLRATAPSMPEALEVLVQRLLLKDPNQRFQSAQELIAAIDRVTGYPGSSPAMAGQSYTAPTIAVATTPTTLSGSAQSVTAAPAGGSRRGLAIGFGIAVTLAAGVIITIVATRGDDKPVEVAAAPIVTPTPPTAPPAPVVVPPPAPVVVPPPTPPPAPATVDLAIDSVPGGADVLLDDAVLGKTPYHGTVPRTDAAITLTVRAHGYTDGKLVVHPTAAIARSVKLEKPRAVAAPPAHPRTPSTRDDSVNPFGN